MAITDVNVQAHETFQATRLTPEAALRLSGSAAPPVTIDDFSELTVFTGIVSFFLKGSEAGIIHENLSFLLPKSSFQEALRLDIDRFQAATASVFIASFAYDGLVQDALWAADASGATLANLDRGTGTANIRVSSDLAVRGLNGIILRAGYTVFVKTKGVGAIVIH